MDKQNNPLDGISELQTLSKLRWLAIIAQVLVAILVQWLLNVSLNWLALAGLFGIECLSNALLLIYTRHVNKTNQRPSEHRIHLAITVILTLDTVLLSLMLALSGGPLNPFSFMYMVHVTMAAVMLPARGAIGLGVVSCLAYGALFVFYPAGDNHHHHHHHDQQLLRLHLEGMWYAFVIASALVLGFVAYIRAMLKQRDDALAKLRAKQVQQERLASLATLSASAAHELSTPLSTIALVAKELEYALKKDAQRPALIEDAQLIRQQVDHCHGILQQMSSNAGQSMGELMKEISLGTIADRLTARFDQVDIDVDEQRQTILIPEDALLHILNGLIRNAQEAYGDATPTPISVSIKTKGTRVIFCVEDLAGGMDETTLMQACEPFFSTKKTPQNLGMGLFLAKNFTERMGGYFTIQTIEQGTTICMDMPKRSEHII